MEIPASSTIVLRGHKSEVFVCAWNPRTSFLASGSGDSTARIWPIPATVPASGAAATDLVASPIVMEHKLAGPALIRDKDRPKVIGSDATDVTTMDWNPSGQILATGCYDGCARLWTANGELKHTLELHTGPLFSLKWNRAGNYLLSGSVDSTTSVWDGESGRLVKQFSFHNASTLDVDWRDHESFASCSRDKMIFLCSLDSASPVQQYEGHRDEVNCLRFDPSGTLLASGSDDYTAKVWSAKSASPVFDLREHTREVYTVRWSPIVNKRLVLATGSFDSLVKLWDINTGICFKTLASHTDPVYTVDFSPDGQFLASGSFDRRLNIWSVKDGTLLKTYHANGGIFEVLWNPSSDKVAGCFSNSTLAVLDIRKLVSGPGKV